MIFIVIFFILGLFLIIIDNSEEVSTIGLVSIFISLVFLLFLFISRSESKYNIIDFHETKRTIYEQRDNKNILDLEKATITLKIIEQNTWLEKRKHMNKNDWYWGYYINDGVDTLTAIK